MGYSDRYLEPLENKPGLYLESPGDTIDEMMAPGWIPSRKLSYVKLGDRIQLVGSDGQAFVYVSSVAEGVIELSFMRSGPLPSTRSRKGSE